MLALYLSIFSCLAANLASFLRSPSCCRLYALSWLSSCFRWRNSVRSSSFCHSSLSFWWNSSRRSCSLVRRRTYGERQMLITDTERQKTSCIDINRNIKKVGVLPIRIVKSNISTVGPYRKYIKNRVNSYKRNNHVTENKPISDYFSYINSPAFLFIFCFSLTKGQRSKRYTLLSVLAVHQPFYISICISTLPTQHTTFSSLSIYIYVF